VVFSPVPDISWRRLDGGPLPGKAQRGRPHAVLEIPSFRQEDEGLYECAAGNLRGRTLARGQLVLYGERRAGCRWELRGLGSGQRARVSAWAGSAAGVMTGRVVHAGPPPAAPWSRGGRRACARVCGHGRRVVPGMTCKQLLMSPFETAPPEWEQKIQDTHLSVYDSLFWECKASGKPSPRYTWLKNGERLNPEERIRVENGTLTIASLNTSDSGVYQCAAENSHQVIYANAELRVLASAPDFSKRPVKKVSVAHVGGDVAIECKPEAFPRAAVSWRRGSESLRRSERVFLGADGTLRIHNVSRADAGGYTCVASNQFGVARSTGSLAVKGTGRHLSAPPAWGGAVAQLNPAVLPTERTVLSAPPPNVDVTVGESVVLPCQATHDPSVDVDFRWSFNGAAVDLEEGAPHLERIGTGSVGDLMIRNVQLSHSGQYVCTASSPVDSLSAAADVIVRGKDKPLTLRTVTETLPPGPPGPPEGVHVEHISSTQAQLRWAPGPANNSPVRAFSVQARTAFSVGWQAVSTVVLRGLRVAAVGPGGATARAAWCLRPVSVPEVLGGDTHNATVVGLSPWVEYEFRVVAGNSVGIGEPSRPSEPLRTKPAAPTVAPTSVSGGGGGRSELVVTWEAIPEELQSGEGFGYVVLLRPVGAEAWTAERAPSGEASRLVYRNESIAPLSPFEVRVGVYNAEGDGPLSPAAVVYAGEDEPRLAPRGASAQSASASGMEVSWRPVAWSGDTGRVLGYEVLYWTDDPREAVVGRTRVGGNVTAARISGLRANTVYFAAVRAFNTAGAGPSSTPVNATTRKPPPSQPPANVAWKLTDSRLWLNWEHVRTMENESAVLGYKVLYRQARQRETHVLETNGTSAELLVPLEEDCLVEIRAVSDGGEGSSAAIRVPRVSSEWTVQAVRVWGEEPSQCFHLGRTVPGPLGTDTQQPCAPSLCRHKPRALRGPWRADGIGGPSSPMHHTSPRGLQGLRSRSRTQGRACPCGAAPARGCAAPRGQADAASCAVAPRVRAGQGGVQSAQPPAPQRPVRFVLRFELRGRAWPRPGRPLAVRRRRARRLLGAWLPAAVSVGAGGSKADDLRRASARRPDAPGAGLPEGEQRASASLCAPRCANKRFQTLSAPKVTAVKPSRAWRSAGRGGFSGPGDRSPQGSVRGGRAVLPPPGLCPRRDRSARHVASQSVDGPAAGRLPLRSAGRSAPR
ncbi:LOW QUALITY PROTEIN: Contactin-6, partial [Galemys pyrenaicus]